MPSIRSALAALGISAVMAAPMTKRASDEYGNRVTELYNKVTGNGSYSSEYFSAEKVPYHSVETLMVEAPDHGHESVSETFSFWIWLEAVNGKITGNYDGVEEAWSYLEKHIIPDSKNQPGNKDPIAKELQQAYGNWDIYIMHWIIDGDNWYGYGQQGDGKTKPSFINTFQRGPSESTWKTVPHPCWESMKWGGSNGFLDLFTIDNSYAKQWRYTAAPDADARAIQAAYFAYIWAEEDGVNLSSVASKAAKLGDYLRYAQYDKYFKKVGNCVGYQQCQAGRGKNSAHYLISWYFAWGGGLQGDWAWRIGSSHTHTGYQNPLAAWVLSTQSAFKPKSSTGAKDWATSLDRQLELFRWLQSAEGCIAGGATNSWQGWGMERVCSLYYLSGNEKAGKICQEWAKWVKNTTRVSGGEVVHATNLEWSGNPDEWNSSNFNKSNLNRSLHGTVSSDGIDIGTIASIIKGLMWVSMKDGDQEGINLSIDVMDAIENYKDDLGYGTTEARGDYDKFGGEVYIPRGWSGKNAQGANIRNGVTFIDIRPKYKQDPDWEQVEAYLNGGEPPVFTYHRFWAQTEIAVANGLISIYDLKKDGPSPIPIDGELTECPASITNQGYACCAVGCEVVYTDNDGEWGVENNEWCGCGKAPAPKPKCSSAILAQGYSCCSSCGTVYYTDADGDWGVENNDWCGMPTKC
ncbi:family 48 glycoside hydrolase [Neocallimastix lanati (nom. inval.)]|nr:family 48 glycoside hydrolase [Neocallimastix sp. JGI-2020a]